MRPPARNVRSETQTIIDAAIQVLAEEWPASLRQIFYTLVGLVLQKTDEQYNKLSRILVDARRRGDVPWEWIVDRGRITHRVAQWDSIFDYADPQTYRRNVWATQPRLIEAWMEADASSGIVDPVLDRYGVSLTVSHGFDSWSAIYDAAKRYADWDNGRLVTVLHFGDLDPSGKAIPVSLKERFQERGCDPEIIRVALTPELVGKYNIPSKPLKRKDGRIRDTRAPEYMKEHGDNTWELEALRPTILRGLLEEAIKKHVDLDALNRVERRQGRDRRKLGALLEAGR